MKTDLLARMIMAVCLVAIVYILYRVWADSLLARERKLRDFANAATAERELAALNGYIWCQLWRRSHVLAVAQKIGVQLSLLDAAGVISIVKQDFHPRTGINIAVIEKALLKYIAKEMPEFTPKPEAVVNGYICPVCDYAWEVVEPHPCHGTCPDCGRNDVIPASSEKEA
jgi:hypothetical protein